jgi:hypothetical protein
METRDVLDTVNKVSEEDVQTFLDVLKETVGDEVDDVMAFDIHRIEKGDPEPVRESSITKEQISGLIRIVHGWHDDDYVWHISPAHQRRTWTVSLERVIYTIAQVMNKVIPPTVEVNIFPPHSEWDIKEITFKAIGLRNQWNVREEDLSTMVVALFEVLNTLV